MDEQDFWEKYDATRTVHLSGTYRENLRNSVEFGHIADFGRIQNIGGVWGRIYHEMLNEGVSAETT